MQQENSGRLCPILQLLLCTAFFICSDKIICLGADDKAAVAGRAEQDTTSAPDLRDATLRPQEADNSGEIPQSWQARAAACTHSLPPLAPIWMLQGEARLPLGSQDLSLMIPKLNYPEGLPNS